MARVLILLFVMTGGLPGLWKAQGFVSYITTSGQPWKWNLASPSTLISTNVVNRNTRAIRYFLGADAYSAANRTAELNAARACFDQWQAVTNSILRFEEGGLISGLVDINTSDDTNVIYWTKTYTVNHGLDNILGRTGVTFSSYYGDGTLAEADIVLNGAGYSWHTDFNNTANQAQFVESVLLHEIGHFIGLAHTPVGGATMYARGGNGVNVQAGLSQDEIAAVHALYPKGSVSATLATLSGVVTLAKSPVLCGIVTAEDATGNVTASTVTDATGRYQLLAMPPAKYQVRVSPVDSTNATYFLFRGADITPDLTKAQINFVPTTNTPVTLTAGAKATLNFALQAGTSALRIGRLQPASSLNSPAVLVSFPTVIPAELSDFVVGVYSVDIPSANAILRVTGDGLTFGPTTVLPNPFPGLNPPLNLLSVTVHKAADATPGLRSLIVQQNGSLAYANGFLEIPPPVPDYNFDGLDDHFQRQYFPRWTVAEAAPNADPDKDGYSNSAEYISGTNPVDPDSVLKVESVRVDASGATVIWPSAPGKRYQVLSRPRFGTARNWQTVGEPVLSTGSQARFLDSSATNDLRFYRIQALP